MRRKSVSRLTSIVFISLVAMSSQADETALDVDSYIQAIARENPGVQRILAQEAIAAGELKASQAVDDPLLSSRASYDYSEPDQITGTGLEADTSKDTRFDLSLSRTYSATGTRLSTSYANHATERKPVFANLGARYYQPSITLQLTQPLLKNAGGRQDRLNITLNKIGFDLARLEAKESLESYITQLAALYLEWYLAYRETELVEEEYQQSLEQEKLVRLKVQRQVAEAHELLRVQETREDYYSRWQQALGRSEGLRQQVIQQMVAKKSDNTKTQPRDPGRSKLFLPHIKDDDYLATESRLKAILDKLKDQQEELVVARKDARRANLDLSLNYTRHGVDGSFDDAHDDALDADDYGVSLQYSYPLGNRGSRGLYESQLASQRQVIADSSQRLIDAEAALSNLVVQAKKAKEALLAADRKIGFAKKKLEAERRLYRIGRLDLFELLQDQTSYLESRVNREQLYVQLLQLRLSIGELLDENLIPYEISQPQS